MLPTIFRSPFRKILLVEEITRKHLLCSLLTSRAGLICELQLLRNVSSRLLPAARTAAIPFGERKLDLDSQSSALVLVLAVVIVRNCSHLFQLSRLLHSVSSAVVVIIIIGINERRK